MAHILIVDDDEGTVTGYTAILRHEGFSVEGVANATDALASLGQARYQLVVADLNLPDISGIKLLEQARHQGIDTPFVIVTGFGTCASAVDAMRRGAVDYVEKPLIGDDLVNVVRVALRRAANTAVDAGPETMLLYAARRWAQQVVKILDSPIDLRTVEAWAHHAGTSVGALKTCCRLAHTSPRRSLILGRLTRALIHQREYGLRLENLLDIHDDRTLASWLSLAGVAGLESAVDVFLSSQRIVPERALVAELQRAVNARDATAFESRMGTELDASA